MNLNELHVKGELSEKGLLKERYDRETDDLVHELTPSGKREIKTMLKSPKYQKALIQMALEESNGDKVKAREILNRAMENLNE